MSVATAARPLSAAALILLTTACIGPLQMPGEESTEVTATILVDNEANALSELTVELRPDVGVPQLLGTVRHNEKKTFLVRHLPGWATYRLVARPLGAKHMISNSFVLGSGDRFEWDLRMNSMFFRGRMASR